MIDVAAIGAEALHAVVDDPVRPRQAEPSPGQRTSSATLPFACATRPTTMRPIGRKYSGTPPSRPAWPGWRPRSPRSRTPGRPTGGAIFAFITVSIGALAGVADHGAGIASGLLNTSRQIGGAIGVAVASTVTATCSRLLLSQGHAAAAVLTGRFQWALWVSGLTALAAVPVTFVLIRRAGIARAVAASMQPAAPASAPVR